MTDTASDTVTMTIQDSVATLTIDDGKANAISHADLDAINGYLDVMENDDAVAAVVITGRPGMFSGGFDLKVMRGGDTAAVTRLVTAAGDLCCRLYEFPRPVIASCTGHAVAAGALVLSGCHRRVAVRGEFKIGLIETQLGMVLPDWTIHLARQRLATRYLQNATIEAFMYDPDGACQAGFVDVVADPDGFEEAVEAEARRLAELPLDAYNATAAKLRGAVAQEIRALIDADRASGATP